MKYHNMPLRDERDSTICMSAVPQRKKLQWMECLPFLILAVLTGCLLMTCI